MHTIKRTAAGALLAVLSLGANAQRPVAYPAEGQSEARQDRDEGEWHVWARNKSGVDPAALAASPAPQETGPAVGGHRARQNQAARNESAQQAQSQQLDGYHRAYAACMSGRGYSIN